MYDGLQLYGHLVVGGGFALFFLTQLTQYIIHPKRSRLLMVFSVAGEAAFIQGIVAMTGFYASPFLFLFLMPPYIHAMSGGPRWAWYSFFLYSPFLGYALLAAAGQQEWR